MQRPIPHASLLLPSQFTPTSSEGTFLKWWKLRDRKALRRYMWGTHCPAIALTLKQFWWFISITEKLELGGGLVNDSISCFSGFSRMVSKQTDTITVRLPLSQIQTIESVQNSSKLSRSRVVSFLIDRAIAIGSLEKLNST